MKYYLIFKKTEFGSKASLPSFAVERESTAKGFCEEFSDFYYEERDDGCYIAPTTQTLDYKKSGTDFNNLDIFKPKGLYDDIKCPHCGASYFRIGASWSTAMYCPTVIKDGKVISKDHNTVTTEYECLNCGKTFTI